MFSRFHWIMMSILKSSLRLDLSQSFGISRFGDMVFGLVEWKIHLIDVHLQLSWAVMSIQAKYSTMLDPCLKELKQFWVQPTSCKLYFIKLPAILATCFVSCLDCCAYICLNDTVLGVESSLLQSSCSQRAWSRYTVFLLPHHSWAPLLCVIRRLSPFYCINMQDINILMFVFPPQLKSTIQYINLQISHDAKE